MDETIALTQIMIEGVLMEWKEGTMRESQGTCQGYDGFDFERPFNPHSPYYLSPVKEDKTMKIYMNKMRFEIEIHEKGDFEKICKKTEERLKKLKGVKNVKLMVAVGGFTK
jgi:hypothetical protein